VNLPSHFRMGHTHTDRHTHTETHRHTHDHPRHGSLQHQTDLLCQPNSRCKLKSLQFTACSRF